VSDGWVLGGLFLFVVLAVVAEVVLWPAERRLQQAVSAAGTPAAGPGPLGLPSGPVTADAARMERAASGALVLLIGATVLMIAQP
jgi:hypothetical protein